ncbi:MAG: sugar phosphate isomerase/epimerase [Lentisphaeria bacterium]|nr:sugar phosphate isomerase/epimerase [Lentisphaeria bacterium]
MRIGIMLMNDRGPDGKPWDWRAALGRWQTCGLQAVDLFDRMLAAAGESVSGMARLLDGLGLAPGIYCVPTDLVSPDPAPRQASLDTVRRGIDACAELGIRQLFSHGGQHNNAGEEALKRYADGLARAADLATAAGITFSIENAGRLCHTDDELLRCLALVGRPAMRLTFDGGNFVLAGCDPQRAAERLAPWVTHVHVKTFVPDPTRQPRPFRYCPVGQGLVDYRRIRDTLMAAGFDGCMSFEPEGGEDSRWEESLRVLVEIVNGR